MSDEVIITVVEEGVKEVEVTDGSRWGSIGGDIDDQTDLKSLLNTKVDAEDLGEMSFVDDAPSDHNEYVRKDGDWHIASGSGTLAWGDISGTLSDQTDLQSALNSKQNTLTFDDSATSGSDNPVKSGGLYTQFAGKTDLTNVAAEFSTSTAYAIDDLVIYQGALYRFIAAHSAGAWNSNHVTACSIAQVLKTFAKFEVTGTASAGSSVTITDSRINSEHWKVPKNGIWFSDSSKVTTQVHWITNVSNHTLTLEATFTGATDVKVDLDWYQ